MVSGLTFRSGVAAVQLTLSGEVIVPAVTLSTLAGERLVVLLPTAMNLPFPTATSVSSGLCAGYRSVQVMSPGLVVMAVFDWPISRLPDFCDVLGAHRDEKALAEGDAVQDVGLP